LLTSAQLLPAFLFSILLYRQLFSLRQTFLRVTGMDKPRFVLVMLASNSGQHRPRRSLKGSEGKHKLSEVDKEAMSSLCRIKLQSDYG
jgi:hypothetical protein